MQKPISFAALSLLALTGCASQNSVVAEAQRTPAFMVGYGQEQERKLETILNGGVSEMKAVFHRRYAGSYPNSNFEATIKTYRQSPNSPMTAEIDFNWSSPKGFFLPGKYNIIAIEKTDGREGVAFADFVMAGVNRMIGRLREEGIGHQLNVTYYGQADGLPIRGAGISYRGEYGAIDLPQDQTTVNGRPKRISIAPGQNLSNEELAALRAFSLRDFVQRAQNNLTISERFNVSVVDMVGQNQRYAKITIDLVPSSTGAVSARLTARTPS